MNTSCSRFDERAFIVLQVCSKIPGFMYLALGDPMQKRNYYRCGWIRFADDVDVTEVVAKLAEAKVRIFAFGHFSMLITRVSS